MSEARSWHFDEWGVLGKEGKGQLIDSSEETAKKSPGAVGCGIVRQGEEPYQTLRRMHHDEKRSNGEGFQKKGWRGLKGASCQVR